MIMKLIKLSVIFYAITVVLLFFGLFFSIDTSMATIAVPFLFIGIVLHILGILKEKFRDAS